MQYVWCAIASFSLLVAALCVHIVPPIEGTVTDADTNQPVKNAVFLLGWAEFSLHGSGAITKGTREITADATGKFAAGPIIYFAVGSSSFESGELVVAAQGYVAQMFNLVASDPYRTDPYLHVETTTFGKRILRIKLDSHEFNRKSLLQLSEAHPEWLITPPRYLDDQYLTSMRADGQILNKPWKFETAKYRNFWCRFNRIASVTCPTY